LLSAASFFPDEAGFKLLIARAARRVERCRQSSSGSPRNGAGRSVDAVKKPILLAVLVLACCYVMSAGAPWAATAPLRIVGRTADSLTLSLPVPARGQTHLGRYRTARGPSRWRTVRLGRGRHWSVGHLSAGTTYLFELRSCRGRRCGRWSAPLAGSTPAVVQPPAAGVPGLLGCQVFPTDNPWNQDVSQAPVDPNSNTYIASIGASGHLHPDTGSNPDYGIPYAVVGPGQPRVPIAFTAYGDQSDPGPYPIPPNAPIEAGSDHHVLVIQTGACKLYELYNTSRSGGGWNADSGAVFDLNSNTLRPDGWTSADAAGLPIFPGLIRYDEVQAGYINHALRFTVAHTQRGYIHPATHFASSSTDASLPPMGLRLRLKAGYDVSRFTGAARVILEALRRYGMIVADNGSNWYVTGASDTRWNDTDLDQLKAVPGSAFEVVQTGPILHTS
jgi:hypothetical protein